MEKIAYKEPEFKVVNTSVEDVITTSGDYTPGQFETNPIIGF